MGRHPGQVTAVGGLGLGRALERLAGDEEVLDQRHERPGDGGLSGHEALAWRARFLKAALAPGLHGPYGVAVAVEFLSDEEAARFGRYNGPPPRADLERLFFLDDADKVQVAGLRGDHNRLGFALLLRERVVLTCRSVDRIFLQAYVPKLQSVGLVCRFLRWQRHFFTDPCRQATVLSPSCTEVHYEARVVELTVGVLVRRARLPRKPSQQPAQPN